MTTVIFRKEWAAIVKAHTRVAICVLLLHLLIPTNRLAAQAATAAPSDKGPKARVQLLADREAISPGQPVTLALRFEIEKGWHIYWRNPGVSGLAPSVQWKLPPGFKAGPLQFPAPRRYPTPVGDDFILEGRPTLLIDVGVPDDVRIGDDVRMAATVNWLVCKEVCIVEKQDVTIALPVQAPDAPPRPANDVVFRAARQEVPVPPDRAKYAVLDVVADVDRVRPADRFRVALVLDIRKGHHIQSHRPLTDGFIATDVFCDDSPGLTIENPVFPPDKRRTVPYVGEVAEYGGRVVIVLPIRANPDLKGPVARVGGVLTYQACDDSTGVCFAPEHLEWSVSLPVGRAGEPVSVVNRDVFQSVGTTTAPAPTGEPPNGAGFSLDRIQARLEKGERPLLIWLFLAVLAGLILNITPCVLPVISIKVLSFVQQAQESPARVLRLGLAFAAGMMVVFNVLAALASVAGLVWGQHFQSPTFVIVMAAIVFAFGLSLFGVYTFGVPRTIEELAGRRQAEGYAGSFAKGALATVLGTPCLGPLLGPVLAWAVTQPHVVVFLTFNLIGVGMAAPYVLLTANPRWLRYVPKPGAWMETFKQLMGFLLMATVVYLLLIAQAQIGGQGIVWTLALLVAVAVACWLVGRYVTLDSTRAARLRVWAAAVCIVIGAWYVFIHRNGALVGPPGAMNVQARAAALQPRQTPHGRLAWQPFSLEHLAELTAAGRTVMVDVTAEWCLNCKYNLKFVLDSEAVADKVRELGVVPLVADWTARDEEIGRFIEAMAPGGSIPLLAIFPAGRPHEPIVMLGIVTKEQVLARLDEAGASL